MATLTVSIIIPTCNRRAWLLQCLDSLATQTYPTAHFEIVVVDDASTDDTTPAVADWIARRRNSPAASYVRSPCRRGPAAARNTGIAASNGTLLAFIDDDCLAEAHWLEQLVAGLSRDEKIDGVGGRVQLLAGERTGLAGLYMLQHHWYEQSELVGREPDFLLTGNCLYTRRALQRVGGFDEAFITAGAEDTDLGRRVRAAGFQLAYCPEAVVYHRLRTSVLDLLHTGYRYGRGTGYLAVRHPARRPEVKYRQPVAPNPLTGQHATGLFLPAGLVLLDKLMTLAVRCGSFVGARRARQQRTVLSVPEE